MKNETRTKREKRFISLFLCAVLILFIGQLTSQPALGATYYVPDDFATIQAAVDGAGNGSVIIVREGTYKGERNKNITIENKIITIQSESGPEKTIIDCEGEGRGFYFKTVGNFTELNGFNIINGSADKGGGIICDNSSPFITNCIITGNSASYGGGIYCGSSSPVITDCTIIENSAGSGGGIYCSGSSFPSITDCIITSNTASYYHGGGIYCSYSSSPSITSCTITKNSAPNEGGGIYCSSSSPSITDCIITSNTASYGGGIYCSFSSSPITNCTIVGNTASHGGGIYCYGGSSLSITNCTITGNSAGSGGGIYCSFSSSPFITNTILYFNPANEISGTGTPNVTYSNIMGGWEGDGNIDEDPQFVEGGDLHLTERSPCIDAGTPDGAPDHDIDGNPRPYGAGYDMGAYEYQGSASNPPDIKANGQDGPITVSPSDPVSIEISIDPGGHVDQNVELWIVVQWPFGGRNGVTH